MLIKYLLSGKEINLTGDNVIIKSNNFNVDAKGNMECNSGKLKNVNISGGDIKLYPSDALKGIRVFSPSNPDNTSYMTYITNGSIGCNNGSESSAMLSNCIGVGNSSMWSDHITTPSLIQTSLESQKKNFEKFQNGLNVIKATEIYKYNLKSQTDNDKKHIGFIIGKNYKYSSEITSVDKDKKEVGADIYSMISVAYKAIQEQQEEIENQNKIIENLIKRIEILEGGQYE